MVWCQTSSKNLVLWPQPPRKTVEGIFKKKCGSIYLRVCPNFKVDVCNMFGCPYALDKTRSRWNVVSDYLDNHFRGSGLFEIKYLCHWQTVCVSANSRLNITWLCKVWHYRLWSFKTRDTKLERFLHKNPHTQRKLLNFEIWTNGEPQ